ncbi:MAG: glycosyltransferase [Thermodesulfobacteriota bacterium]|nr:glycosyltransferase [Thermodesulfobacteriota bacterium]
MNLAYITVTFPSITESFVLREVNYLRENGNFKNFLVCAYKRPAAYWLNTENQHWLNEAVYLKNRHLYNAMAVIYYCFMNFPGVCRLISLWLKEIPAISLHMNIRFAVHILVGFGAARYLEKQKIDHIHAHFDTASTLAFVTHLLTGISFSYTAHASADIYTYFPFCLEKMKYAKRIIAVSKYNRKYLELISHYEVNGNKIEVLYNGVSIPKAMERKSAYTTPTILMTAAFTGFKGYGTCIRAMKILKERKVNFLFYAVGNGPLFHKIKLMIEEEGLCNHVQLLGFQPMSKIEELLQHADIFVFPSEIYINGQRDGMPTAITEAMAFSLPIVATYITGIPEQVIDGINGYLVPERQEEMLAIKLEKLLVDHKLRIEMGRKSYSMAKAVFNIDTTIPELVRIFKDCIHESNEK